jgi:PEGA domain
MRLPRFLLAGALALLASTALAQPPPARPAKPLAESLHGPAKDAYATGLFLYKRGDLAGAESKYWQAYDLSKDPRLVFNAAVVEKDLHHYARMQALLLRYEQEMGTNLTADDKAGIATALAALKNLVGTVTVTANVAGADVVLDDERVGTTPLAEPLLLDLGKHKIVVQKDGFDAVTTTVDVQGGAATTETLTLRATVRNAQLVVVADPDATIVIDGATAARGRFDGPVPAGAHDVSVTAPGKVAYKAEVDLHERESRSLQVTLVDERHHVLWPWIAGGAALVAAAAVGGYFLFKPQDHLGAAPTGDLGSVTTGR